MENNTMSENINPENKISLPHEFTERMKKMLKGEYQDFLLSYEKERLYGLRYNPLKAAGRGKDFFLQQTPFELKEIPWTEEGFYYKQDDQPGKHYFHEAGVYYIQEPSAMAAVEALGIEAFGAEQGERILDLCAAPGGKSTHIAGKMSGKGLLVANEIIPGRAKILSQNIERMGIPNAIVCNETPERMAEFFPEYFDKILVDAPCSGEGMFRKDETTINEWSPENVKMCAKRQKNILEQAATMLKAGGVLVYSTCTFSIDENEGLINDFLKEHKEFSIEKLKLEEFFGTREREQIEEWIEAPVSELEHTVRILPHKVDGEGHFIARLKKANRENAVNAEMQAEPRTAPKNKKSLTANAKLCRDFLLNELGLLPEVWEKFMRSGEIISFGEQIYLMPEQMMSLRGIKVLRPGLHLGTVKKDRLEPAHALALYLSKDEVRKSYEMSEKEAESYLHGDVFSCDAKMKGWTLLTIGGYSIGFGKAGNGQMKNHYPKGLRR
ncbi:MAG: RsmF rRNA methyltransferase first C-terminal domain-containing protein [Clostridiales bacterium]|nr:RsmF rRNA methyltransferase first C-terminal domain-containing protein [Clostridiales bacterium]